ncbi:hypothetical protein IT400_00605 [Candidatus Nomurabacteria bacterium]|nr:hypothetical protein [Candidatus Nomurabacteria bacterium]
MKNVNLKSGYSIIEIIIYVAVFAIISIIVANAFVVLLSFFNQSRTNHDLLQNGNTALERMSHEIRIASAVKGTSVFNTSPGTLELDSLDSGGTAQVIKFSVSNGALNISKDGTVIDNLLGDNIKVTSLIFRNVDTTNSKVVKIEMTLQDSRDKTASNENFYNIVVLPKEVSGSGSSSSSSSTSTVTLPYSGFHSGTGGALIFPDNNGLGSIGVVGDIHSVGSIKLYGGTANITGSLFSGGSSGSIAFYDAYNHGSGYLVSGNSTANTVENNIATGTIYCQSGTGNNKSCDTSQPSPVVTDIPDWSTNIAAWKAEAEAGGTCQSGVAEIGPCKSTASQFYLYQNVTTINGPVWVTGELNIIQIAQKVKLPASYGSRDGVIIADDYVNIGGWGGNPAVVFEGSGAADSNILIVATKTPATYFKAIQLGNVTGNVVFYAPNGGIYVAGPNINVKGIIAKSLQIGSNGLSTIQAAISNTTLKFDQATFSVTP